MIANNFSKRLGHNRRAGTPDLADMVVDMINHDEISARQITRLQIALGEYVARHFDNRGEDNEG
jgi:hypothetical protein